MNVTALLLLQTLTLGVGEHRSGEVLRSECERWDVVAAELSVGPWVGGMTFRHGLTSDHLPAWFVGLEPAILGDDRKVLAASVRADTHAKPSVGLIGRARWSMLWVRLRASNRGATLRFDWITKVLAREAP
jgi:hypothetical protein